MDNEEVVSPEDARTVASWAICSVRAQKAEASKRQ